MRVFNVRLFITLSIAIGAAPGIQAEIVDAEANGFTVRHSVLVEADRLAVYEAAVDRVSEWWSGEHTVSGDAKNLYLSDTLSGCFCESLGDGAGLVHLSVSFVNPGVMIRLSGGLGPLGLMGVSGNMTWEFDAAEDGTVVTWQYAVGGYMAGGLDTVAPAVDAVLVEQMARLATYVESGTVPGAE